MTKKQKDQILSIIQKWANKHPGGSPFTITITDLAVLLHIKKNQVLYNPVLFLKEIDKAGFFCLIETYESGKIEFHIHL